MAQVNYISGPSMSQGPFRDLDRTESLRTVFAQVYALEKTE